MPAATETETKNCLACGQPTQHEIPQDVGKFAPLLRRLRVRCDDCQDELDRKEAEDERLENEAIERRRHKGRVGASGVPPAKRGIVFDDLIIDDSNRAAIESAKEWAAGDFRGLVLSGVVGVGKTYIATAAANEMLRHRSLRWFAASRFMTQARAGFKHASRDEVTDVLTRPDIALVLDDIDKVSPTDYTKEIIFQAIDDRLQNETPILITTNRGYVEIEAMFGEPIASRISTCRAHRIEGKDRRRSKGAA